MAAMSGLILLAGAAAGGARWLAIALVFMVAMNGTVYFLSGRVALTALRARPVSGSARSSAPSFTRSSGSFPHRRGSPCPGSCPRRCSRTLSRPAAAHARRRSAAQKAFYDCSTRELRGVLGHELSHIYNRDVLISSVDAALATAITFVAGPACLIPLRSDDDDGTGVFGLLLMLVLGPVAAPVIQVSISRARESRFPGRARCRTPRAADLDPRRRLCGDVHGAAPQAQAAQGSGRNQHYRPEVLHDLPAVLAGSGGGQPGRAPRGRSAAADSARRSGA